MNADLAASLQSHFGFTEFRPGQREAIQSILSGQHTLVVMPTGAGKSLVFQLAALHCPGVTLVISPLIALMKDQVDSLERRGLPVTFINSALSAAEQDRRLQGLAGGKYRLVYLAPERLRSLPFLNALKRQQVGLLAVDEAHCISEWGHDFRPDYLHIARFRSGVKDPLTVALTATATPEVQDDITRLLDLQQVKRVVTGFNRPNLAFDVRSITSLPARLKALQELLIADPEGAAIIYTGTRREAEEVADFVREGLNIPSCYYHGGLPAEERTRVQDAFMARDLSVVVATNAFGMGIDRPDVRLVVHYSLPGSVEAYYQEAGRAGRDGQLARAVLLYSPEDRALQEWFIESSASTTEDLRLLFEALRPASARGQPVTIAELSCLTSLPEVKIRTGLAELERSAMLERLSDEGLRIRIKLCSWREQEIHQITQRLKQHQVCRRAQLDRMVAYAESNACRRRIILHHFGDKGPAEAAVCCDNCQARLPASTGVNQVETLSQAERIALIVLDAVRRLQRGVGSEKVALILKGSKEKDILQFGYDKTAYYGKLAVFSKAEIRALIEQLLDLRYLKVIGGEYPVLHLTPQGEMALQNKTRIPLNLSRRVSKQAVARKQAERQAGGTVDYSLQLLSAGLSVAQVASERGLSLNTIYSHAAQLIAAGRISVEKIVPEDVRRKVEAAISQAGSAETLYPIKILLPEEIDYNVIRCVVEHWKRERVAPEARQAQEPESSDDPVTRFLSRSHPRSLPGPWESGWALGFHSQFAGSAWARSETGELAYRLKYQHDHGVLPALVDQAAELFSDHPELAQVDAVVPVPPSLQRASDPVSSFAQALAQRLGLAYRPVLVKSRQTAPQKAMSTLAQKRANVAGAFAVQSPVRGSRLLVVDDLFDSGATLEEITRLLQRAGAARVCVMTLTRTIHADA